MRLSKLIDSHLIDLNKVKFSMFSEDFEPNIIDLKKDENNKYWFEEGVHVNSYSLYELSKFGVINIAYDLFGHCINVVLDYDDNEETPIITLKEFIEAANPYQLINVIQPTAVTPMNSKIYMKDEIIATSYNNELIIKKSNIKAEDLIQHKVVNLEYSKCETFVRIDF